MYGCNDEYETGNYRIKTTPAKEWSYVVDGTTPPLNQTGHDRTIHTLKQLMEECKEGADARMDEAQGRLDEARALIKKAKLLKEEVAAVILYTGPMVNDALPCPSIEKKYMTTPSLFLLIAVRPAQLLAAPIS